MAQTGFIFKSKGVVIGSQAPTEDVAGSGGIVVDATVQEEHKSSCDLTENPVEDGAKITDHVQLKPKELSIDGVISDTPLGASFVQNFQNSSSSSGNSLSNSSRSIDAYQQLLELQKSREPFTVTTGLKQYTNMILVDLSVPRTVSTANAIHFKASMKEIRIVKSKSSVGGEDKTAKKDSRNRASKTKDSSQKTTEPVPAKDPVSDEPSAATEKSRGSLLFEAKRSIVGE